MAPRAAILCATACLLAACAERAAGSGDIPTHDVEPRDYCPKLDAGPLLELASEVGPVTAGPCGHLIYAAADQQFLYTPGVGVELITAEVWTAQFATTGHLAAWSTSNNLILRNLLTHNQVELPPANRFGFVPAPDAEHGADLWTCSNATLELAGPAASATIANQVDCASVKASTGSPRVVFADTAGQVLFADLEAQEVWDTQDHEYQQGASSRDDTLWIDHDGVVIVHDLIEWQMPQGGGESDAEFPVGLGTRVIASGESIASWGPGWTGSLLQTPVRSAPVSLRGQSAITTVVANERHDHAGTFTWLRADASGRTLMLDTNNNTLLRLAPDAASLEQLAGNVEANSLHVAPSGEWIALEIPIEDCLLDTQGECEWLLTRLALWHDGESLRSGELVGLRLETLAVTNDGHLLALGIDVSPGETPDPLPPEQLLWLDANLEVLATVNIEGTGFVRELVTLDDGRLVIELHNNGEGVVLIANPEAGTLDEVPNSVNVDHAAVWVGAPQDTLAFVRYDNQGSRSLVAGALP